jgi:hypothetical protein
VSSRDLAGGRVSWLRCCARVGRMRDPPQATRWPRLARGRSRALGRALGRGRAQLVRQAGGRRRRGAGRADGGRTARAACVTRSRDGAPGESATIEREIEGGARSSVSARSARRGQGPQRAAVRLAQGHHGRRKKPSKKGRRPGAPNLQPVSLALPPRAARAGSWGKARGVDELVRALR